ncbi:unnamed protein product [Dovyalis caffra]|uniref:Uncharacterized protein n=1 Tax=Dovyalis caffra TaxID=77055 RepID=A0AAV1QR42_9ROSI|nr:unnamed protein product [Dovyalis caffra]CAK7323445.1 unnamed protein product [Dovyalis caffra]
MSERSQKALMDGGSSYSAHAWVIEDVMDDKALVKKDQTRREEKEHQNQEITDAQRRYTSYHKNESIYSTKIGLENS